MSTNKKTCYFCGQIATSKEHAPPKCLFPEQKDSQGDDFRKELITVPSCELHNSAKSKDDEFLLFSLAGVVGPNEIGQRLRWTKIERAQKRHKFDLADQIIDGVNEIEVHESENYQVVWGPPKIQRLKKCFEHIARAIYYHDNDAKVFKGQVSCELGFLQKMKGNALANNEVLSRLFENDLKDSPVLGANPAIFTYQIAKPDDFGGVGFRFMFYEKMAVYGAYLAEGLEMPESLVMESIARGIPTAIPFGDDEVWFNKEENEDTK